MENQKLQAVIQPLKRMPAPKNFEVTVDGIIYELFDTTTDKDKLLFIVDLGIKDDEDSLISIPFGLYEILDEVQEHECELVEDYMGSDGEHATRSTYVSPEDVWEEKSDKEKAEYLEDKIIIHLKSLHHARN